MQYTLTQTIQRSGHRIISSHRSHFSFPALSNNKSRNSISQLVSFSEQQRAEQQQRQFSSIQNKKSSESLSFKDKMLSGFWLLPGGDRALSRVDPFRLSWPDEFDRMARRLEEDMWRRHHILEELDDSLWRDSLMFFNNPERSGLDTQDLGRSISSSVEHYQNGKEHTFKRSVTVNGKTDTVTAKYDGEKTVVTYDGDKTLELPGFYDITVDVVKQGNEATKAIDEKLANMNKLLRGELGTGDTQMKLEQGQQQGQQQQKEQAPTQAS